MGDNLIKYYCRSCEKNFYLDEKVEGVRSNFVACPRCRDFVRVEEKK